MATLSQTAASVVVSSVGGGQIIDATFGATIVAGNFLYYDTTTTKWKLADANGTAAQSVCGGIALCGGGDGQPGKILTPGTMANPAIINLGATLVLGFPYFLDNTAGSICPASDIASGVYATYVGSAQTTALFIFQPCAPQALIAADIV